MIVTYGTIKAKQAVKDSCADPRLPVRDGRPDHQGDAGRGDGQGRPAQGDLQPRAPALRRGRRVPRRSTSPTPTSSGSSTPRSGIEGLKRQWGVHAAGVIMSSEPLIDVIPLLKRPADGAMITQFDYPTCESLGLIKMDFLGLRNLTVLDDCAQEHRGQPRRDAGPRGARRSTTRRPTSCSHAATRSASSSSTAARCGAAALDAARQLRGHLRGRRALPARPDGRRTPTTSTPAARPAARPIDADPPRARRAARGDPRARPTA